VPPARTHKVNCQGRTDPDHEQRHALEEVMGANHGREPVDA
jgi:hypothetical protein